MILSKETIVRLYNEAVENGDPQAQIRSLAKTNGVPESEIREILIEADVLEEKKRGRKRKEEATTDTIEVNEATSEPPGDKEEYKELYVAAGLPIPDAVKECLIEGLEKIELDIQKRQEEIRKLEARYETIAKYLKQG